MKNEKLCGVSAYLPPAYLDQENYHSRRSGGRKGHFNIIPCKCLETNQHQQKMLSFVFTSALASPLYV